MCGSPTDDAEETTVLNATCGEQKDKARGKGVIARHKSNVAR
jgi:hypothetical protein